MAGRPRNPAADTAIMTAALTLDDVADRAGIGKSSLYRRFHDRADLATAAIASQQRELPPPPETCGPTSSLTCGPSNATSAKSASASSPPRSATTRRPSPCTGPG
jgi:hypothetical protein